MSGYPAECPVFELWRRGLPRFYMMWETGAIVVGVGESDHWGGGFGVILRCASPLHDYFQWIPLAWLRPLTPAARAMLAIAKEGQQ